MDFVKEVNNLIQSRKKWNIQQLDEELVKQFQHNLHISSIAAKILISKGINKEEEAYKIIHSSENDLHDPFLLSGMKEAVFRIQQAIEKGEKILVYGDYDADGLSSTAVMLKTLQELGANVDFCIPNRFLHGYGPNEELFQKAYEDGVKLIVTVDNGISGIQQIQLAKQLGMDIIVTDHHEPGSVLPEADVIIHPKVPEGHYPFDELAGVGVAFKLAHALYGRVPEHLFEYAAIGTVADLVPLIDENRYIVKKGIEKLRRSRSPWVIALCEAASINQQEIDEEAIGFYFGPRINAIGRLGDASPGVEFFISENIVDAQNGAKLLNSKNIERKDIVKKITEEAIELIENNEDLFNSQVLCVAKEGWHQGVVGIVASKLVEKYYKPTIILSIEEGIAKGSGRSIEGFHLFHELEKNRDLLDKFGGHAMACGMSISVDKVDELRKRLNEQSKQILTDELLTPTLNIDVSLNIEEITVEAIEEIEKLSPFGVGFSKPKYIIPNVEIKSMRKIGANEDHLKLELGNSFQSIDAIGFYKGYLFQEMTYNVPISFVGDLQINEWQGIKKPQFQIEDVKTDNWQLYDLRSNQHGKLAQIPTENTIFLAFREETIQYFYNKLQCDILLAEQIESIQSKTDCLAILDLPSSIQQFEKLIQQFMPKRIYAIFHKENPIYFQGVPSREQFGVYYTFLKKQPNFHITNLQQLSKQIGLSIEVLHFMTKVFLELGFVKIENGYTKINVDAPKRSLDEATTYQKRCLELEVEKTLLYSNYQELRNWLDMQLKEVLFS